MKTRRTRVISLALGAALATTALAGCGEDDFANEARPPVPLQLTGVVTEERVTVSPNKFGGGPVVITLSNQSGKAHTITLEGETVRERVGPINPEDTATIQATLDSGQYVVKAGSEQAVTREIRAATLVVGRKRDSASDELLLP